MGLKAPWLSGALALLPGLLLVALVAVRVHATRWGLVGFVVAAVAVVLGVLALRRARSGALVFVGAVNLAAAWVFCDSVGLW